MTPTIEDRVATLEAKVTNLETWAGPGQNDALSGNMSEVRAALRRIDKTVHATAGKMDEFGKAQATQQATLDLHTGRLDELQTKLLFMSNDLSLVEDKLSKFKAEVTGRFTRLDNDVTAVKEDVAQLKADVTDLRDNVTVIEVNLGELKEEVTGRLDRVDGTLAEILDRLPPKAA